MASSDILVQTRAALLEALDALSEHRGSIIVIGAQAVYLRTAALTVALAETTKDSDVVVDPRGLASDPTLDRALTEAGFVRNATKNQPGAWVTANGIEVDLMIPDSLGGPGRRAGRIPPHDKRATRKAHGLEAALIDNDTLRIESLDESDSRVIEAPVAGSAALLIAKLHKLAERIGEDRRVEAKDAHDAYRLLLNSTTEELAATFQGLLDHPISAATTIESLDYLRDLFAAGADAPGAALAGEAEIGVGEPETVALQASILAKDLVDLIRS